MSGLARLAGKANAVDSVVINLGNSSEIAILELAKMVISLCRSRSEIIFQPLPNDDPTRRCPDISQAKTVLGWEPLVSLEEGLKKTISWFEGGTQCDTAGAMSKEHRLAGPPRR